MDFISLFASISYIVAGLSGLTDTVMNDWIQPVFFVAVAVFAFIFIKDRAWMKLLGFVGIAAIVGALIFAGDTIIGEGEGGLSGIASDAAEQIN